MNDARIVTRALLATTALFLAACSSTPSLSSDMAALDGEPLGKALTAWGEPDLVEPFGEQRVLTWLDRAHGSSDDAYVICKRQLAVDGNGVITGWRWRGDACESALTLEARNQLAAVR
jgi:hypothetical protein